MRKRRPGFLRNYALRIEAEGKPKMLVINAMRNKLAHLICPFRLSLITDRYTPLSIICCALIRTKTQFIEGYRSIEPRMALKMT